MCLLNVAKRASLDMHAAPTRLSIYSRFWREKYTHKRRNPVDVPKKLVRISSIENGLWTPFALVVSVQVLPKKPRANNTGARGCFIRGWRNNKNKYKQQTKILMSRRGKMLPNAMRGVYCYVVVKRGARTNETKRSKELWKCEHGEDCWKSIQQKGKVTCMYETKYIEKDSVEYQKRNKCENVRPLKLRHNPSVAINERIRGTDKRI